MKILIAYGTKNGTVAKCVERLQERLTDKDVTTVCLERESVDPAGFDIVVVGSCIRFEKLRPCVQGFLRQYEAVLCQKRLALFLCCANHEEYEYYAEKRFSEKLRVSAFEVAYFGGSLHREGLSFFDKMLVNAMRSKLFEESMDEGEYSATLPAVLPENIDRMAGLIREEWKRLIQNNR